jgi:hypothetical protein
MSKKSIDSSKIDLEKKMRENKIKKLDNQIDLTVKSISTNEVNHMLKKIDDAIYKQIKKTLDEEKASLDDAKSQFVEAIRELDNRSFIFWLNISTIKGGFGYRKISQWMNQSGIKTHRGKKWFSSLVISVLKRRHEYDLRIEEIRNQHFPSKVSNFEVNYYIFD